LTEPEHPEVTVTPDRLQIHQQAAQAPSTFGWRVRHAGKNMRGRDSRLNERGFAAALRNVRSYPGVSRPESFVGNREAGKCGI
jgi:hypothetical protein